MTYRNLKSMLFAATVALTLLVPAAHAQAAKPSAKAPMTVSDVIAEQGNAALRAIRAEMKATIKLIKPAAPARATTVSAPGASSAPATAALAE